MLKHIVMFRLKTDLKEKTIVIHTLKDKLECLKNKISQVKKLETGRNISRQTNAFDLILVTEFESEEDLEIYRAHPDHQEVVSYIREVVGEIIVVDYMK